MAVKLQKSHRIWLSCHPNRTESWLRERLEDGFHIYHADGDHKNDTPSNLIMIEGLDHMLIVHGHKVPKIFNTSSAREMGKKRFALMTDSERTRHQRKAGKASAKARQIKASAARIQDKKGQWHDATYFGPAAFPNSR